MSSVISGCACLRCQIERNVNRTNPDPDDIMKLCTVLLRDATLEQIEGMIEDAVAAAPNLFVVARGLRAALQDDWEKSEVAELLMEGVKE